MIDTDNNKVLLLALVRSRPGEAAAAPEERRPNCLLMSTGEHHRCLKFDSAPQINRQPCSTSKCFTVTAQHLLRSSAPNKNGRHPEIDYCQRELLVSAPAWKLFTKATEGSPAPHFAVFWSPAAHFHIVTFGTTGTSLRKASSTLFSWQWPSLSSSP